MATTESASGSRLSLYGVPSETLDARTLEILAHRRRLGLRRRRGWLVRRLLALGDALGLACAFAVVYALYGRQEGGFDAGSLVAFLVGVPVWVVAAKLAGLYARDGAETDYGSLEDVGRVFHLLTLGSWAYLLLGFLVDDKVPPVAPVAVFWATAVGTVTLGRGWARAIARRSPFYIQNTIVVGAGEVGQRVGRKILQHPEYGLNLVGFVDSDPRPKRADLHHLTLLGSLGDLPALVRLLDVDRVVVAFSTEPEPDAVAAVRALLQDDVRVDVVPRFFDVTGPNAAIHSVEGFPVVGLPPVRPSRSSRLLKRAVDLVGASLGLVLAAPVMLVIAAAIRATSAGPILYRQTRLGMNMKPFTILKFRTMRVDTDDAEHRAYIEASAANGVGATNGVFKLERRRDVTPVGRWLRRSSLDELPQLVNVVRGDMSLVGPRPCIPYEVDHFAPHHYERFLVPAGLTGLWQVTARARSTFAEALELDVAYARGWSLRLDLSLIVRTIAQALGSRTA